MNSSESTSSLTSKRVGETEEGLFELIDPEGAVVYAFLSE
jgi:hypothetical protein